MVAQLDREDPRRLRFGARAHGYRLRPPIAAARLDELGLALPDDYRRHLLEVGDGGAGPYHGLMPLDHPVQLACARRGAIGLAHVGCGQIALLVGDVVVVDATGSGDGMIETGASFHDFFTAWAAAMATRALPRGFASPGRCALPAALTAYLDAVEGELGLRRALEEIPDGGITTAQPSPASPFFDPGDPLELCPVCARTVENLIPSGMRWSQITQGVDPIPSR
jgi:hypothetical protein